MNTVDGGESEADHLQLVDRLLPIASRVIMRSGEPLDRDGAIYFPLDGVATLILSRDDARCQVGFARRGDAVGLPALFVPDFPTVVASVLRSGAFIRVTPEKLRCLMTREPAFRDRLSDYAMHAMGRYLSEAAGALAMSLEQRVARWIMLCRRALDDDIIPVTHERIGDALGVPRSGVTVALHVLEGRHFIMARRGRIEVRDREGLRSFATAGRRVSATGGPIAAPIAHPNLGPLA